MKTIDLLVKALPAIGGWPAKASHAVYAKRFSRVCFTVGGAPAMTGDDVSIYEDDGADHGVFWLPGALLDCEEPVDYATAIITRKQYEAALAAKNEGWIEWGGGKHPPVSTNTVVDVKLEKGYVQSGYPAGEYSWEHVWQGSNIIAYRLHQPKEAEQAKADDEDDLNECIGQATAPLWNGEGLPPVGCECEYSLNGGKTWWKCKIDYIVGTQGVVMLCDTFEGVQYVQFSSYGNALKFRPIRSETERKRDAAKNAIAELCRSSASNGHSADLIYDAIAAGEIPGVKLED